MELNEQKLNVILVDDHRIFRDGFKLVLNSIDNIEVVAETNNGEDLISLLETQTADIIFLDINMPRKDGFATAQEILEKNSEQKIVILTTFDDMEFVNRMTKIGVSGYILKDADYEEIEKAIKQVSIGETYFSTKILVALADKITRSEDGRRNSDNEAGVTHREGQVLELLCQGFKKGRIAEELGISTRTVDKHKENLFAKTGTNNAVSLVVHALRNNLAEL